MTSLELNPMTGLLAPMGVRFRSFNHQPGIADYQYKVGTIGQDSTTQNLYILRSTSPGNADWRALTPSSIDFIESALSIAVATNPPPSSNIGDRYIIDTSLPVHADWDGAIAGDVVEYDGATWDITKPTMGSIIYVEDVQKLYVWDGVWQSITDAIPDATTTTKGIASFEATQFDVTAGHVSLTTVDIEDGGTGQTSLSFIDFADATLAPPTELLGDRYILDYTVGVVDPAWDGATNGDIVEFNGVSWIATTPIVGMQSFNQTDMKQFVYITVWEPITAIIPDATTTVKGVTRLSTVLENQNGLLDTIAATPASISGHLGIEKQSGFQEWTGAGVYYTTSGTDFTLARPGIGWINSRRITWLGGQTVPALSAGATHYIYIDSTGTIGSTATRTTALFQDNIVLFEVMVDSTPVTPVVIVTKENHSLQTHPSTMNALHDLGMHGYDVVGPVGGTITLHGTVALQVVGNAEWHDHDLETAIPDSAAAAINIHVMYTNGAGKWVQQSYANTLPTQYNNAGTPTALAGNERTIFDILVSKDDIESAAPQYFAVMNNAKFASLALANAAVANTNFATATNELAALEMIRMGVVVMNATQIDSVTVAKQTIGTGNISQVGTSASLSSVSTVAFDAWLSAADTTVQAALETLDDTGKDSFFKVQNTADPTKVLDFDASLITAGNTRTITMADQDVDLRPNTGTFQASDADLITIAALAGTGFLAHTGAGTWAERTWQDGTGTAVVNPGGVLGNPQINILTGGMSWTRVVGDTQALAVQNGYIPTNVALTTFTLPTNSAVGDVIKIDGESAAFFKIAQNADQQIHVGVLSSTVGIGGSVTATHRRDCITLRCTVANSEWIAEQWNGNPDVV